MRCKAKLLALSIGHDGLSVEIGKKYVLRTNLVYMWFDFIKQFLYYL